MNSCEKVERVAMLRGIEFVPDNDVSQLTDEEQYVLCAKVRAEISHIFTEAQILLRLSQREQLMPGAIMNHLNHLMAQTDSAKQLILHPTI